MTRLTCFGLVLLVLWLALCVWAIPVGAQTQCYTVRVIDGLKANVRNEPSSTSATTKVLYVLTYADGSRTACNVENGFYEIALGEWVSGTWGGGRPLLSIVPIVSTPTPGATRTATARPPTITPTKVTPVPTDTGFWIELDGTYLWCAKDPCVITIRRQLPTLAGFDNTPTRQPTATRLP